MDESLLLLFACITTSPYQLFEGMHVWGISLTTVRSIQGCNAHTTRAGFQCHYSFSQQNFAWRCQCFLQPCSLCGCHGVVCPSNDSSDSDEIVMDAHVAKSVKSCVGHRAGTGVFYNCQQCRRDVIRQCLYIKYTKCSRDMRVTHFLQRFGYNMETANGSSP